MKIQLTLSEEDVDPSLDLTESQTDALLRLAEIRITEALHDRWPGCDVEIYSPEHAGAPDRVTVQTGSDAVYVDLERIAAAIVETAIVRAGYEFGREEEEGDDE
jgi:hypothetical protein